MRNQPRPKGISTEIDHAVPISNSWDASPAAPLQRTVPLGGDFEGLALGCWYRQWRKTRLAARRCDRITIRHDQPASGTGRRPIDIARRLLPLEI